MDWKYNAFGGFTNKGIILLYGHIKNRFFSFSNKRFLGCRFQIYNPFFSAGTGKPR